MCDETSEKKEQNCWWSEIRFWSRDYSVSLGKFFHALRQQVLLKSAVSIPQGTAVVTVCLENTTRGKGIAAGNEEKKKKTDQEGRWLFTSWLMALLGSGTCSGAAYAVTEEAPAILLWTKSSTCSISIKQWDLCIYLGLNTTNASTGDMSA